MNAEFARKRRELFEGLKSEGRLTPELERSIIDTYGSRGKRAVETVRKGWVVKRGNRWFIRSESGEYEIVRALCSCPDYALNVVTGKANVDMCYHALAKTVCETLGGYYVTEPAGSSGDR